MKMTTLKSVAIAVGLASSAFGQATSPVVGYYTETLNQGFNAVGVSLHNKNITSGTFTAELEDTGRDFTALLADANATYLLEITSGAQNGAVAVITGNTATTLTVEGGALDAGAADYTIREAATLNELFGSTLVGNTFVSPTNDVVFVPNGSGGFDQFSLNTGGNAGAGEFRSTSSFFAAVPDDQEVILFYPDGVFIQQAAAAPNDLVVSGALKTTGTILAANAGFNLVASPAPVGSTLFNSGLQDSLVGGTFVSPTLDILFLPTATGFDQFAFNTGANEWRTTASFFTGSQNDVALPSAFFIQRAGAPTAALANTPDFFAGL